MSTVTHLATSEDWATAARRRPPELQIRLRPAGSLPLGAAALPVPGRAAA